MNPTLDSVLRYHQDALSFRAARQEVIASNIANADTPGYRARDIGFGDALRAAQAHHGGTVPALARTAPGHFASGLHAAAGPSAVSYRTPLQPSADGNSVNLDTERAQFADNAVRYEANLMFIGGQLKTLLSAIQG